MMKSGCLSFTLVKLKLVAIFVEVHFVGIVLLILNYWERNVMIVIILMEMGARLLAY